MTDEHTPERWYAKDTAGHDIHGQTAVIAEDTGKDVAIVYDGDAHAKLIAAAPELLEALEAVYQGACEDEGFYQSTTAIQARAVIEQATEE